MARTLWKVESCRPGGVVVGEPTGSLCMRLAGSDPHHARRALPMRSLFGAVRRYDFEGMDSGLVSPVLL